MIRSSNGVRLLSSHLIRDACRSIYEGVFHRTVDSGVWTLSRVRGHATVNPNNRLLSNSSIRGSVRGHATVNPNNRLLSNSSIRGSVSLSRPDYERSNYPGRRERPPVEGVSAKDFRKGFKDWCNKYGRIFSSEGEKDYMFKWFCDNYRYGREFSLGCLPRRALVDHIRKHGNKYTKIASEALLENLRQAPAFPPDDEEDTAEVYYSNKLSWDELNENKAKCCSGRYIGSDRLTDLERDT